MDIIRRPLRWILERLSRGRSFRRRLPAAFGSRFIYVSPDAALRHLLPGAAGYDRSLLELAKQYVRPDSVVWDIGANVGVFTLASAARGALQVVAVEPDPFLAGLLRRTCRIAGNRALDIDVVPVAVSDRDGLTRLDVAERGRAANTIREAFVGTQRGGVREDIIVPTMKLDTMLAHFSKPTLVKIDVEGAEALVLSGASRVLEEARPVIFIEVSAVNEAEVRRILLDRSYVLFDGGNLDIVTPQVERCVWSTLAKPVELMI